MIKPKIGVLHPGNMGISVAASAQNTGCVVYWASEGRSAQTHERAESRGLLDAQTLAKLCETCTCIVSVCPPHAAGEVAAKVLTHSFRGVYLDANAISPQRAIRIGQAMEKGGVTFVDGGIVGGPAWKPGETWLYLSGENAEEVAACFSSGPLETEVIGTSIGKASALKMCYAAYTKGTAALLCTILAAAEELGVRNELMHEWSRDGTGFGEETEARARRVTTKAWRFAGEMDEIAATFQEAGLPGGFHLAAGDVYRRIAGFKDASMLPSLEDVLAALVHTAEKDGMS
jgi:3-hydroxyisobutyrate dehydrogenase-like beta-hydroxyacid dehydrogenase